MTSSDAQTYARGLYEVLIQTSLEQLRTVTPQLVHARGNAADLQQQIDAVLPTGTSLVLRNFLLILARDNALDQLESITSAFEQFGQGATEVIAVDVTSAVALSPEQQERIRSEVQAHHDAAIDIRFRVDADIIGGLIIRVGDNVLDNSLRTRLSRVQRSMLSS
ncbi:MAG: ATP synthase F1 subunit delta [Chloroflexaceae bacterium]|nr:ATP synthase F1 subunit delta [Chloroflexaceae bacterium]NJO06023.1 ATP synthase F1 subunit delta [Chloroflexaceae bacterium]